MDTQDKEMLGPFRIRNLHNWQDGVVALQPSEYDRIILLEQPEAVLTYLDEDDGETITVGSSIELRDRLADPVVPPRYPTTFDSTPMHIFDIQRSGDAILTWRELERTYTTSQIEAKYPRETLIGSPSVEPTASTVKPAAMDTLAKLEDNARRYLSGNSGDAKPLVPIEDMLARNHWLQACDPPQISQAQPLPLSQATQEVYPFLAQNRSEQEQVGSSTNITATLTPEGERKAKEAGERLRWMMKSFHERRAAKRSLGDEENRWASYKPKHSTTEQPDQSAKTPGPSLLQSFKADLAKTIADNRRIVDEGKNRMDELRNNAFGMQQVSPVHNDSALEQPEQIAEKGGPTSLQTMQANLAKLVADNGVRVREGVQRMEERKQQVEKLRKNALKLHQAAPQQDDSVAEHSVQSAKEAAPSLLQSFEADLAKAVADRERIDYESKPHADEARAAPVKNHTTVDQRSHANAANDSTLQNAGELLVQAVQALTAGVGLLGSEVSRRFPEFEERLTTAQHNLPEHIGSVVTGTIEEVGRQAQTFANKLQQASDASRNAADRTREADLQVVDDMLNGFTSFVGEVGKTLWSTFEADTAGRPSVATASRDTASEQIVRAVHEASSDNARSISPIFNKSEPETRASQCQDGCLIGPYRLHEHCIFRELILPQSGRNDDYPSHLQTRQTPWNFPPIVQPKKISSSESGPMKDTITKSTVQFADSAERTDELPTTVPQRHRSMDPLQARSLQPFVAGDSLAQRFSQLRTQSDDVTAMPPMFQSGGPSFVEPPPRLHHMQSTPAFVYKAPTILDQDPDPEFTARYPSLMSSTTIRRSNTVANPMSSSAFLRTMNPESEIARYPTVSQLEQETMQSREPKVTDLGFDSHTKIAPQTPSINDSSFLQRLPGAWPQVNPEPVAAHQESPLHHRPTSYVQSSEESSGAFFERMTGRRASAIDDSFHGDFGNYENLPLRRAHTTAGTTNHHPLTSSDPAARLPGPFDPLTDLAHDIDHHHGPEGSAPSHRQGRRARRNRERREDRIDAPSIIAPFSGSRRPYSTHFTGAGRIMSPDSHTRTRPHSIVTPDILNRDTISRPRPTGPALPRLIVPTSNRPAPPPPTLYETMHSAQSIQSHRRPAPPPPATTQTQNQTSDARIKTCVDHLKWMGYGSSSDRNNPLRRHDYERLRVYAIAADGDVGEAIEMIDEERKAWERFA